MSSRSVLSTPHEEAVSQTSAPGWAGPTVLSTAALGAVTMAAAVAAMVQPLHAPNQSQELGFPVVSAPIGIFMVVVAAALARRGTTRWAGLLAGTGVLWVFNALLVAARSLGVNGHVPHVVYVAATWVEQWFYVLPDLAAFVVLPMALPGGRITGRWRYPVAVVLAAGAGQVVGGAFGSGLMDDTYLHNPFAVGQNGLISLRDDLYLPTLLIGLVVVVVRGVVARRRVSVPMCAALVTGVVAILLSSVAEGMLESPSGSGLVPWLPVAVAVPLAVVLWARVARSWSDAR